MWTDITYDANSLLTSQKMTQNQANFHALAEGLTGAPKILTLALNNDCVDETKLDETKNYTMNDLTLAIKTRYHAIPPSALVPRDNSPNWAIAWTQASSGTTAACYFVAPVNLPHGAVITSFRVYWYRSAGTGSAILKRANYVGGDWTMATANTSGTGNHSTEDTSIDYETINNSGYSYSIVIDCFPSGAAGDVLFYGAVITFTIVKPLP